MDFFHSDTFYLALQLVVAVMLGGIIGTERNVVHKSAGMRTYALVCMGSALFIIVGVLVTSQYTLASSSEPLRIAAAIITGIGFLGAGLIVFKDEKLSGLTTGAGLWVASGIGIAVGFGFYAIAITTTILTLFIFEIFWRIETKVKMFADGHSHIHDSENNKENIIS